jgi:hypothetical protein
MIRKYYPYPGTIWLSLVFVFGFCDNAKKATVDFVEIFLNESSRPIHPGFPGNQSFWNINSKRFIYARGVDKVHPSCCFPIIFVI